MRGVAISSRMLLGLLALLGSASGAGAQQQASAAVAKQLEIAIEQPSDWQQDGTTGTRGIKVSARSSIQVTGRVKHPQGIADVLLAGNRASLAPEPDGWVRFTGYVRVTEKMTSVEIAAVTATGARIPVKYNITPTAPPPAAATPEEAWVSANSGFTGKRWAVIVGISSYQDTSIVPLKYADRDAKAFYDFLRSPLAGLNGFDPENITILLNEQATYQNIRVALFDFLKGAAEEDIVYIYFAGHGSRDPERLDNMYLLPYNANAKQLGGTGFPMEDMNKALRQVAAKHKVLITDACHSGGISTDTRSLTLNQINTAFLEGIVSSEGVHVTFTASGPNQLSHEGAQWGGGHGVFTYALLEGMKGAGDADADHIVTIGEVMDFTRAQVMKEVPNRAQIPTISTTAYDYNFPVALVLPGTQIAEISMTEIAEQHQVNVIMTSASEAAWLAPDSLVMIAGVPEPIEIRLDNEKQDVLPGRALKWTSSNPSLATITADGVVHGLAAGNVLIRAEGARKNVTVPVRLLPRPAEIAFTPLEPELTVVATEELQVATDLLLTNGEWLRGMLPRLTHPDSAILRHLGNGRYVAEREGDVKLTASIAGRTKEWTVHVIPPRLKIRRPGTSLPTADSVRLHAWRSRPDGSIVGDAANVQWRSSDTAIATIRNGVLRTHGMGRVTISGFMGAAQDTTSLYVLGDLLVSVSGKPGENLASVSIATGSMNLLLPPELKGAQGALSPLGDRIAFVTDKRIHVMNADGTDIKRLTPDMAGLLGVRTSKYEEHSPAWTYDGQRVVFSSNAHGNYEILSVKADGTDVQRLTDDSHVDRNVSAAPDLPRIAFERTVSAGDSDIVVALLDGSQPLQFTTGASTQMVRSAERKPRFLPGGSVLAYVRRAVGRDGEALALFDVAKGMPLRDLVPAQKDHALLYAVSPDGRRLAYHQQAEWGKKNSSIVVIDAEGTIIKTISLGNGVEVEDISWGASPVQRNQEGK